MKKGSNNGKIAKQTTTNWTFNKQNDNGLWSFDTLSKMERNLRSNRNYKNTESHLKDVFEMLKWCLINIIQNFNIKIFKIINSVFIEMLSYSASLPFSSPLYPPNLSRYLCSAPSAFHLCSLSIQRPCKHDQTHTLKHSKERGCTKKEEG